MPTDYQQTDVSSSAGTGACIIIGTPHYFTISAGAAAGSISQSHVTTSGGGRLAGIAFNTSPGDPGTATYSGTCTMRLNITTANTNITWGSLYWCNDCALSGTLVTSTTGLAISLGTTGVKTASIEVVLATNFPCITLSSMSQLMIQVSNSAMVNATFNWINDQIVTLPFGGAAPPAAQQPYVLAQTKAGI